MILSGKTEAFLTATQPIILFKRTFKKAFKKNEARQPAWRQFAGHPIHFKKSMTDWKFNEGFSSKKRPTFDVEK